MADKLIITKDGIIEQNFTFEEITQREQEALNQQLNPSYQQPNITETEINFAQAIIDINDRLTKGGM